MARFQMDSLITAAARALAAGNPLGALNRVALRDDEPELARSSGTFKPSSGGTPVRVESNSNDSAATRATRLGSR